LNMLGLPSLWIQGSPYAWSRGSQQILI
jgi:hypothetical protein